MRRVTKKTDLKKKETIQRLAYFTGCDSRVYSTAGAHKDYGLLSAVNVDSSFSRCKRYIARYILHVRSFNCPSLCRHIILCHYSTDRELEQRDREREPRRGYECLVLSVILLIRSTIKAVKNTRN